MARAYTIRCGKCGYQKRSIMRAIPPRCPGCAAAKIKRVTYG